MSPSPHRADLAEPQPGPALHPFWTGAFRPLFLFAAINAIIGVVWWVAAMAHGIPAPELGSMAAWHAHEMIFGFAGAAIGGFLLTAIANWTGRPPIQGRMLMALTASFVIARIGAALGGKLPDFAVIGATCGYFVLLIGIALRELLAANNYRNLRVVAVIALFAVMDGLFVATSLGVIGGDGMVIYRAAILTVILLIALIGGRVIPAFTRNWMARAAISGPLPAQFGRFDAICLMAIVAAIITGIYAPDSPVFAAILVLGGGLHFVRLLRWRGFASYRDPIVAMLHLAYFWVPAGLILFGVSIQAPDVIGSRDALHGLSAGAISLMVMAIGGRAALGHTGRELRAGRWFIGAFALVWLSTLLRICAGLDGMPYLGVLAAATLCWLAGWICFGIAYGPILVGPVRPKSAAPGIPIRSGTR